MEGLNDTADTLMASIARNEAEVSPSTLYAAACILEGVPYVNGAPQNTFVPGLIELAVKHNVLIGAPVHLITNPISLSDEPEQRRRRPVCAAVRQVATTSRAARPR